MLKTKSSCQYVLWPLSLMVFSLAACAAQAAEDAAPARWTAEKANAWYQQQPWLVGCTFIPSTAVNQLEMWQAETFDPQTIDRELGWAAAIGMNSVRVYLHDLVWQADAPGFKQRVNRFLELAHAHGLSTTLVIFDDCWNENPKIGKQPEPIPGVHNSRWVQSPGNDVVNDPDQWERLERYLKDIVATYGNDSRVLLWDVYNAPGNRGQGTKSLPLLKKAFQWAREAKPSQPLSASPWSADDTLNAFMLEASDIITFHNFNDAENLTTQITELKQLGRPLICTEWLRRSSSTVGPCLPIFKRQQVGCYTWGLVLGKTQTVYPWGSPRGAREPKLWFHDLLRADGTPYDRAEIACFHELTGRGKPDAFGLDLAHVDAESKYPADEPLMILNADGSQLRNFLVVPGYENYSSPVWSHDGSQLAFDAQPGKEAQGASHVFVAKPDGSGARDLGVGSSPSWSPDDQRIAFHRNDDVAGIWAMNADGSGRERLTTHGITARWSLDGTEIAYIGSPGASGPVQGSLWRGYSGSFARGSAPSSDEFHGLCTFSTIDGSQQPLVKKYEHHYHPGFQWSPDGSRLAFVGGLDDMSKELVIVSGRSEQQKLTVRLAGDIHLLGTNICWSGDGKRLLVEYGGGMNIPRQLYWVEVDSNNPPVLIPGQDPKRYSGDMTLSPDGTKIVFASFAP